VTLTLLGSVLEDAVRQGNLSRNVAKMVERPSQARHEMKTWTAEQAATFLEAVASDRLGAAFSSRCTGFVAVRYSGSAGQMSTLTRRPSRSG
jgi:site-specific recombinase XerC